MKTDSLISGFSNQKLRNIVAGVGALSALVAVYYCYKRTAGFDDDQTISGEKVDGQNFPMQNGKPDIDTMLQATSSHQRSLWAEALKTAGNGIFKTKYFRHALAHYEAAMRLEPENPIFLANAAACYSNMGDHRKTVELCTTALSLQPDYPKVLLRRAAAYEALEDYSKAMIDISMLSIAKSFSDNIIEPILERVLNKQGIKRLNEMLASDSVNTSKLPSSTSMSSFFAIFPPETEIEGFDATSEGDKTLIKGLVELQNRTHSSFELADEYFEKAWSFFSKELDKDDVNSDILIEKAAIAAEYNAIFRFLKSDPVEASKLIEKAIEIHPRANSYIYKALINAERQDSSSYLKCFDMALKLDPMNAAVYYHRGQMNFILQSYDAATRDFEKAKDCDPSNIFPYIQLACVAYRQNDFDNCERLFKEAAALFPDSPEIPNYFAEILTDKGDYIQAENEFDKAIELEGGSNTLRVGVSPYIGKARLLTKQLTVENYLKSVALIEQACKIDPRSEQAKLAMAQIKLQEESFDEAVALFEEAAQLSRPVDDKLQAITFAEAAKIQQIMRSSESSFGMQRSN